MKRLIHIRFIWRTVRLTPSPPAKNLLSCLKTNGGIMQKILIALGLTAILGGCAPLIIGGGAAVIADEIAEDQNGGDGLF